MIRPATLLTFFAFIASGMYLYQVKHRAQLVDQEIHKVREATAATLRLARDYRTEYEQLNRPDRLAELASDYLPDLKATQPAQWTSLAEIERRLPPVGDPTETPAPLEPGAPAPAAAPLVADAHSAPAAPPLARAELAHVEVARAAPAHAAIAFAAPPPASPPPAPPRVASVLAPQPRPAPRPALLATRAAGRAAARPFVEPPPIQVAAMPLAPPPRAPAPAPSLLPRVSPPAGASLLAVVSRPPARPDPYTPPTAAEAVARIPAVASALGMARTMLTVSPVTPAEARTIPASDTQ